ncbi:MAG: biopolymer transporter ExbD [bacterium]|nr:biopolymer transporter ExbD [bacterium]
MRRTSLFHRRAGLRIEMTPMIDVVFLLLIFFVYAASDQVVEQLLPSALSMQAGASPIDAADPPPPEEDYDDIVVRMVMTGGTLSWRLNESPLTSIAEVQQTLKAIAAVRADAPVILHPDAGVELGDVIDAYDAARLAGFEKIQFAANLPRQS